MCSSCTDCVACHHKNCATLLQVRLHQFPFVVVIKMHQDSAEAWGMPHTHTLSGTCLVAHQTKFLFYLLISQRHFFQALKAICWEFSEMLNARGKQSDWLTDSCVDRQTDRETDIPRWWLMSKCVRRQRMREECQGMEEGALARGSCNRCLSKVSAIFSSSFSRWLLLTTCSCQTKNGPPCETAANAIRKLCFNNFHIELPKHKKKLLERKAENWNRNQGRKLKCCKCCMMHATTGIFPLFYSSPLSHCRSPLLCGGTVAMSWRLVPLAMQSFDNICHFVMQF